MSDLDCSEFVGRLLDLCTGIGHDGRPDPRPESVEAFRKSRGRAVPGSPVLSVTEIRNDVTGEGPGTELKQVFESLGIRQKSGCLCNIILRRMNNAGPEGCRSQRNELVEQIRTNATQFGIRHWAGAAARAVASGIAFRINPVDPIPGLFDEAVRRAEEKEKNA